MRLLGAILMAVSIAPAIRVSAQQDERAVRAAYVFNLTKYVTWPDKHDKLSVGVIDQGGMGPVLKSVLDNKSSDGRPITVVMHSADAPLNECDVLYVSGVQAPTLKSIIERTKGRPVLTVGDNDRFVRSGGMIALVRSGDEVQIEINLSALRSRHMDVSSRLLSIAVIVSDGGGR
jgi:hypothetical protein